MKITSLPYLCLLFLLSSSVQAQNTHLEKNVVYGHTDGMAMVYDVETPDDPNGLGIIFLVSGGWHSGQENLDIAKRVHALSLVSPQHAYLQNPRCL